MGKLDRKLRRNAPKVNPDKYINETIIKTVAVAAEVVYNDWGKLKKKENRLSVFVDLFIEGLLKIEEPSERRQKVEKELRRMVTV